MKLVSLELAPFALELRSKLRTAHGEHRVRPAIVVRARDDAGHAGFGEAAPLPSQGTEDLEACRAALQRARSLVGAQLTDPASIDGLLEETWWRAVPAARHALELALLDLLAQERDVSIAELISPCLKRRVPVNALLESEAAEALAAEALQRVRDGFTALKLKVAAAPLAVDLARVRAVREAVGPAVELRVDANGGWSLDEARVALPALDAEAQLALCEQPVAELDDLEVLSRELALPLAADELLARPDVARAVLERRAASVLILKPMVLGGVRPALALSIAAREAGLEALVTTTLDGAIARAGALQLAAALPDLRRACGLATGRLLARDLAEDAPCVDGALLLPRGPGLGVVPSVPLAWENL